MNHPDDLEWLEEPLPDPTRISQDGWALGWIVDPRNGDLLGIRQIYTHEDRLNPLRWHSGSMPLRADGTVRYWVWVKKPSNMHVHRYDDAERCQECKQRFWDPHTFGCTKGAEEWEESEARKLKCVRG